MQAKLIKLDLPVTWGLGEKVHRATFVCFELYYIPFFCWVTKIIIVKESVCLYPL